MTDDGGYLNLKLHRPVIGPNTQGFEYQGLPPTDFAISDQFGDYHSFSHDYINGANGQGPYDQVPRLRSAQTAGNLDASGQPFPTRGIHSIQVIPPSSK